MYKKIIKQLEMLNFTKLILAIFKIAKNEKQLKKKWLETLVAFT
jgi:hypothetical protein